MRFAGDLIEQYTEDSAVSPGKKGLREIIEMMQPNRAPYSFDPSQLDMTVPEMRPGPFYPGQDLMRDKHILFNPGSGVSYSPTGTGDFAMQSSARNLREPFPMRQDINRPLDTIPTHPIIGPDGKDKFPGFEIRSVMPRV